MRKLLLAAIVATLGLARAAEPSPTPQAGAEPKPAPAEKAKQARKDGAKPTARTAPPVKAKGGRAKAPARPEGAARPEPAKPCEPVKPCPIDG